MTIIAILILIVLPINWWATWSLWRLSRAEPDVESLRERAVLSIALSVILTLLAIVFLNADLGEPLFTFDFGRLLARLGVFFLCLPAIYWLWLYRHR